MRSVFILCLLIGNLVTPKSLFGQEPFFHRITTEDGLSSNCVYSMSQDRDGYIWLATDNGVCRFDGFSFKYFTQAEGLTDNEFFLIKQDSKGRIWLLPSNGIPCFIENGKVHNPTNTPFLRKIVGNSWFTGFGEDGEGNIWISTYLFRIFKVNRNNEVVQFNLPPVAKLSSDISIDFEGKAWVLNGFHSYCLSKNPKFPHPDFISFREKIVKPFILKNRDIIGSGDSSLYFCSNSEKRLLRADGERIKSEIIKVSQINDSTVLLVSFEGVFIYDIRANKYKRLISEELCSAVLKDRENNIWVSTSGNGVFLINNFEIKHYKNLFGPKTLLQCVYDDNGTIWLGGDDGRVATLENNRITEYNFLNRPRLNGRGRIRSIEYVDKDRFALNFEYRLIFVKDRKLDDIFKFGTKSFIRYRDKFLYGSSTHFSVVPITKTGIMLAGNGTKSLGHLNHDPTGLEDYLFDHNRTTDMVGDSLGRVWMATNKGLIYYNFPGNKLDTRYLNWFLLKKPIQCVEMVNDHLLCGIQGFGLGILFKDKLSLLPSSSFDGALIRKIVSRDQNSFWVCTNKGLFFLRAIEGFSKFTIQRFAAGNGLLSNEVNDIISRNGLWFVACDRGLSLFPANLESYSRDKPPGLTSNYILINSRKISESQNPTYTEGNVEIDFAYTCLDFRHFRNLIFRYRLNEKDEWKIKRNASQRLSNLSEGEYRIEIQAKSRGSSWGPSLYMPEFTVVPPFWQRTWFLFLVVIGSVGASSLIVYNFIRNHQERANLDNQLTEANLKALRAQIKPHFIFNALNSVQHFFLENQKEEGLEFLGRFSQLIRKMLKGSDNQFHSLEEEIELIGEYLEIEKDRIGDFFRFGIDVGPGITLKSVQIPTMLLQPMVENALWHGIMFRAEPGGIIELKIRKEVTTKIVKEGPGSERLIITVTDNGAGRKAAEERRNKVRGSFGLRSIRQKLELLNKKYSSQIHLDFEDLINENNLPAGTRVILNLPLEYLEA